MPGTHEITQGSFWDRFLDMFAESIIIQSLITALLITTLCFLWIYSATCSPLREVTVPSELLQITMIVLGFWFGQKTQVAGKNSAEQIAYTIVAATARERNDGSTPTI